ncbi:hypothetical protein [Vibrio splendidus]|uniref:hypothetical protein n=1 Tax=Vibrio splendidus TaxID=29497 RepID=UPI00076A8102|nr:hypothetical protein [Vibrio splendidus]PHX05454.1 hypothetical protein VSPL_32370 [Vibrio splendidus]
MKQKRFIDKYSVLDGFVDSSLTKKELYVFLQMVDYVLRFGFLSKKDEVFELNVLAFVNNYNIINKEKLDVSNTRRIVRSLVKNGFLEKLDTKRKNKCNIYYSMYIHVNLEFDYGELEKELLNSVVVEGEFAFIPKESLMRLYSGTRLFYGVKNDLPPILKFKKAILEDICYNGDFFHDRLKVYQVEKYFNFERL